MKTRFSTLSMLLASAAVVTFVLGASAAYAQIVFGPQQTIATNGTGSTSLVAVDLDGDGNLDLVVANRGSNSLSLLLNNGTGTFTFYGRMDAGGTTPVFVIAVDLDGDGKRDLVVANKVSNTLTVFRNKGGNGTISLELDPTPLGTRNAPVSVTAADFNGDSRLDLAVANIRDHSISVLLQRENGQYDDPVIIPALDEDSPDDPPECCQFPTSVTAGDLDGDGNLDLAGALVALFDPEVDNVQVLLNKLNDGGGLPFNPDLDADVRLLVAALNCTVEECHTISITAADLDNDRRLDLAIANESTGIISVLLNNGNDNEGKPTFRRIDGSEVHRAPVFIAAADLDRDSLPDLIVVNRDSNSISVLRNTGGGGFIEEDESPYEVGRSPNSVVAADLNSDGRLDLAVANSDSNTVSVLLNRTGEVGPPPDIADPVPDIKVNGTDGHVDLPSLTTLTATVALDPGDRAGADADWWLAALTPFGWYSFSAAAGTWVPGLVVTHQGPLVNLPVVPVLSVAGLPPGTYQFYFVVDLTRNGVVDSPLYYDVVTVTVV